MSCFDVDLKDCGIDGFIKISNLHIITHKGLQDIAKPDTSDGSAQDILQSIIANAAINIESDISEMLNYNNFDRKSGCIGRLTDEIVTYTGRHGVDFELNPSKYLVVDFNIVFFSPVVQDITFFVEENGIVLWTDTITTVIGENKVPIYQTFAADIRKRNFFIGYDQVVQAYKTTGNRCEDYCGDWYDCGCHGSSNYDPDTGGIVLEYEIYCSLESFICKNVKVFKNAFYFAVGLEYELFRFNSQRINTTTQKNRDIMLMETYEKRYKKALNAAIKSLNLCDDCCFKCNPILKNVYVCP